jgi:hypothetical protein
VLPAITYAFRQVVSRFHEFFPEEPFFVREYRISTAEPADTHDLAPIVMELVRRREHVDRAFGYYGEQALPLGFLAKWLGCSIADVMDALRASTSAHLLVESGGEAEREASVRSATEATSLVVTRSALATLLELRLLDAVAKAFELFGPMSLLEELRKELDDAETSVSQGTKTAVVAAGGAPMFMELEPNAPELLGRRDALQKLIDWSVKRIRFEPLPIARIEAPDSPTDQVRQQIGPSSYDALAIVLESGRLLYADDLGLRRFALEGAGPVPSVSIVGLLDALVVRGGLVADQRAEMMVALVLRRYGYVAPTAELLAAPIRAARLSDAELAVLYDLLIAPPIALANAARVGAELVTAIVSASIYTVAPARVARRVLETLARRWPAIECVKLFWRLAQPRLQWHDRERREIEHLCRDFVSEKVVVRPPSR